MRHETFELHQTGQRKRQFKKISKTAKSPQSRPLPIRSRSLPANVPHNYPVRAIWFDPSLTIQQHQIGPLLSVIKPEIEAVECRKRKRSWDNQITHQSLVLRILANALRVQFCRRPAAVSYYRKADGYSDKTKWPSSFSGNAMSRTVDLIHKVGMIKSVIGERDIASMFSPTEKLISLVTSLGIDCGAIKQDLGGFETIKMKNVLKQQIPLEDSAKVQKWRKQLDVFNKFIGDQKLDLDLRGIQGREMHKELYASSGLIAPEMFNTGLYRTFNNSSFDDGGRLYGGWWQFIPSVCRKRIAINGESTVELDFSGCSIRMIYHRCGFDYLEDPYELSEICDLERKQGKPSGYYRDSIKSLVQALINGDLSKKPEMIDLPHSFAPHFRRKDLKEQIFKKHFRIAQYFGRSEGIKLQRLESDIALDIITELAKKRVLSLPIHDSFVVANSNKETLRMQMRKSYSSRVGYQPLIS